MIHHEDRLREAFESHEHLAPDPAKVYARVQELSKAYVWRRRGAQTAGGIVVGAGLIAGVLNLPSILPAGPADNSGAMVAPAAAPAVPSVSPSPSRPARPPIEQSPEPDPDQKQYDAYFNAGYDYDDAVKLAKKWKMDKEDIGAVKVRAGQWLIDGKRLPVRPSNDPDDADVVTPKEEQQVNAFFNAGYDYDDAVKLAKMWKKPTPYEAKIAGGKKILAGETLPIQP